ncbi:MAG: ABC transporter permease [Actinomycetota bacterium]
MPEPRPDTTVAEREITAAAVTDTLPVDAGVGVPLAAVEAGDEGIVKKKLGLGAWLAIVWLTVLVAACALADFLPIPGKEERVEGLSFLGPTTVRVLPEGIPFFFHTIPFPTENHFLGGDALGIDMLSLLIYGARNSLFVAFGSVAIGIIVGGSLGLIAGYYRGRLETVIMAAMDVLLSVPALILALSLTIFLEDRVLEILNTKETAERATLTLALGLIAIPTLARITRANTLVWAQREFVTAARAQGAKNVRIMVREVLPNVVPAMAAIALLAIAVVVVAEASLSILGAGIDPPAPTWGNIITGGFRHFTSGKAPYIVFEPSIMIFVTVLSLNYLGDAVRAKFDVREGGV